MTLPDKRTLWGGLILAGLTSVLIPLTVRAFNSKLDVSAFDLYARDELAKEALKELRDSVRFAEIKRVAIDIKCNPVMKPSRSDKDCYP